MKIYQEEVAKAIGKHIPLIGRYERGEIKPSIEVAMQNAEVLKVSLDYLVGLSDLEIETDLKDKIITPQQLKLEFKESILKTLEALLRDAKTRQAYS